MERGGAARREERPLAEVVDQRLLIFGVEPSGDQHHARHEVVTLRRPGAEVERQRLGGDRVTVERGWHAPRRLLPIRERALVIVRRLFVIRGSRYARVARVRRRESDAGFSRYGAGDGHRSAGDDDDIARLATTATRAFADDPLLRWFFPDDDEYFELNPPLTACTCAGAGRRRTRSGAPTTASRWRVGAAGTAGGRRRAPDDRASRAPAGQVRALRAAFAEHTPTEPHWYLNMLATHPDWQRQGSARR